MGAVMRTASDGFHGLVSRVLERYRAGSRSANCPKGQSHGRCEAEVISLGAMRQENDFVASARKISRRGGRGCISR
jgi:hypothetical protein